MNITIREFEERDSEGLALLWSIAFGGGATTTIEPFLGEGDAVWVAEIGGNVLGAYKLRPMKVTCGPAQLKSRGLGAFAVHPEFRRSGIGTRLIRYALQQMHSQKVCISPLHSIRNSYYRRFGWESAGRQIRIKCSHHCLPR